MKVYWSLLIATCLWLPNLHRFFEVELTDYRQTDQIAPKAKLLAERHLHIWRDTTLRAKELNKMQRLNPEWDFMSRMYFVLALTNMALHDPTYKSIAIEIIDVIIEDTLVLEKTRGHAYFLLQYAQQKSWAIYPPRSIFIEGEIAVMLGARRFLQENRRYRKQQHQRVKMILDRMKQSPIYAAESYPHECWLFCNTVALAAIKMMDALDRTDHSTFFKKWLKHAQAVLIHPKSKLLISTYDIDGSPLPAGHCPEGSTIFMSAHMLQVIDPTFAKTQYTLAKQGMMRSFLGFGYAREWTSACTGVPDIDSGPIIPFLQASTAASGLAVLGAAAFNDRANLKQLLISLNMIGFPQQQNGQLQYLASNPVGDAVLLYGLVEGPLWQLIREKTND